MNKVSSIVFFQHKKAVPGITPESRLPTHESLARRIGSAGVALSRSTFQSKAFVRIVVLLLLALAAVCGNELIGWWDRRYPKPPLGIIAGELLKGFERYSPDYTHTEEVLADVMRAEIPRTVPCNTPACHWLEREIGYDALSSDRPIACQDFYEHVCWMFEDTPIYERATRNLMVQVADYLTSMTASTHDESDIGEDVSMLRKCIDGDSSAASFALNWHAEGESYRFQHKRRLGYQAELESVRVELIGMPDAAATDYGTSVHYDYGRNVLLVPQGLLAVMAAATDVVEPIPSVLLFTQLMRPLLPQPSGPYSWKYSHDQHLAYVTGCLRSVYNASLDFDGNPRLLLEFARESALLGPLYDVYHRGVYESVSPEVLFNQRYTNSQLLFVLWALSHCGTRQGAELVNAAVRNSMRFGRIFNCGIGDPMFSRRKCNFWVYW
ncbi:hypothetical protein HPB49_001287 [Dermacentor silvarum]|uniref:Uncharacterized protein n=1 Tax=Dermacentor silvarum TaxID=543639 RepID=A0ACB8C0L5_DERSI|nr:hypothetical protein HPB49_001287 [Dermacentor silvarum]